VQMAQDSALQTHFSNCHFEEVHGAACRIRMRGVVRRRSLGGTCAAAASQRVLYFPERIIAALVTRTFTCTSHAVTDTEQ